MIMEQYIEEAISLLKQLIEVESVSRYEDKTAEIIVSFFQKKQIQAHRLQNNIWVKNAFYQEGKPTILLNSHHDTVKPHNSYKRNPFEPVLESGRLYGLGSNDAGASLVSLLAAFLFFYDEKDLKYNLIFAASAEEEISGSNGIELLLPDLGPIDFAIVGEPTGMQMAIAERGLLVLDCEARGITGHAARNEGVNAIYKAIKDIQWFRAYSFPKVSDLLGPVKMTVSMIHGGTQHNVVPDNCSFTVDIRTTEQYTHLEILETIRLYTSCSVKERSMRLAPSFIDVLHPAVQAGLALGCSTYGSPTTSDQALMNFPTFKMGPGDSARSHSADEFVWLKEIEEGIHIYINLLKTIL